MLRVESKQVEAEKWSGTICPKIKKKLDKFTEWSASCRVMSGGNGVYHVASNEIEISYVVDLPGRCCDCKRWQLSGIPCHHAIACCRSNMTAPESLVHSCYSIERYKEAYGYNLIPLRGRAFWEKTNGVKVHPPLFTKVMGRPKKNRRKAPEEKIKNGAKHLTKHGVSMHCSVCGNPGHNKKGHDKYIASVQVEQDEALEPEGVEFDDPSYIQVIFFIAVCNATNYNHVLLIIFYFAEYNATENNPSFGPNASTKQHGVQVRSRGMFFRFLDDHVVTMVFSRDSYMIFY
jgi:hypothetical protein